jgi:predicted unusual protein kinase regulating ubiquinone biosynthesis (AarF/ABC1/UbiB family)
MSDKKYSKVPASRLSRAGHLGGLTASLVTKSLLKGAGQLLSAKKPTMQSTVFTSDNASSIASQLSKMRGAAMKVGQMLSMDAGEFLPPQWEPILASLRAGADAMPKAQLLESLKHSWGADWPEHFEYFSFDPIAAASIGQVHKARLKTGETLAVKVQYPGVAQSIDSDINNVGRLIKLSALLPNDFDIEHILQQAKQQLKNEANYLKEASFISAYREHLQNDASFVIPAVYKPLSSETILCMEYIDGEPLEALLSQPQEDRNEVMNTLFRLLLNELFEYSFMQSDPNFANYLYLPKTKQIALLDFGACQHISSHNQNQYKAMATAMMKSDIEGMKTALLELQLLHQNMPSEVTQAILDGCLIASECLHTKTYNFKQQALVKRLYGATQVLINNKRAVQTPEFDTALINRKISGMVLLANKMQSDLSLQHMVIDALALQANTT